MDDQKVKILLVDDKPDKLLALEAVLEELGEMIVRAYSGREALRALLSDDFAVILLDVNMPGMDGFETASLIRQRKSTEDIPIIFVTAFDAENHSSRGYQLGAVDYIQTPVVPEVLKTKVSVFVDLYRKTEQVRRQAHWLRQQTTQLHKLTAASLSINSATSTEKILRVVTDTAREIIGAHRASTTLLTDDNWAHAVTVVSASDKYVAWREGEHRPDGAGIQSLVCRMNKPARMTQHELENHPVWQSKVAENAAPPMRGWLAAPLTGRDHRNLGLIELTDKTEGDFGEDDQAVLVQLAQMASIAIENTIFAEERETNRIKDEFLSTLSHELRTPLNAILGWTQLLQAGTLDEEVGHAMEVIERNAKAQAKLVEDLLDVSRVTNGKLRINTRPVALGALVSAAVDALRPTAEERELELRWENSAGDESIIGDSDRLQQVAGNLLSNAIKFTPAGGRIEVRLDRVGAGLQLCVRDTGRGISPTFLPHVFDRFRQADSTSTRTHGGLGIGLTIVRRIVELHGGSVRAESAGEGHGATFIVTLPTTLNAIQTPARPMERRERAIDLNGVRVLVIDDEADARDVVARVLSRAGATTTQVCCVPDAFSAIAQSQPDVIVSDIAMPDEDGYDFIRKLRELPPAAGGSIPALALTAYAREEDRLRCITSGFQAHVAKPVDPTELITTVAQLIRENAESPPELKCG